MNFSRITMLICPFFVLISLVNLSAQDKKTFIAYSMKVAGEKIKAAINTGENFRKKQPDVYYLAGITRPHALVIDQGTGDWILLGERDPKSKVLTLDDWVTALRARFIHRDKDPGVTIDPLPCEECLKAGKKESCHHSVMQEVQFFGGVKNTHFGQVCYEADWLMKKIALGLEKLPVQNLKTYYELSIENSWARKGSTQICARFWFYPIVNRVNVLADVVLLEKCQLGVFTEVLYAEVDGKPVVNLDQFHDFASEGFARSFSTNYEAAANTREVLSMLQGMTRLAALAKGLCIVDKKPDLDFYLKIYPSEKCDTIPNVEVLKVENAEAGFQISGGVNLMALAMRLKRGDASALHEMVLKTRPSLDALTWGFEFQMDRGQLKGVTVPLELEDSSQIASLFAHAEFLRNQKHYDAAIEEYSKVIQISSQCVEAYNNRGIAYIDKGEYARAIEDYNKAISINPNFVNAYINRGFIYYKKGEYAKAIEDYNKAISINPNYEAYNERGITYAMKGEYAKAIEDYNKAISINPNYEAYNNKGLAYAMKGEYAKAIEDYNKAISINPNCAEAYNNRGSAYVIKGEYAKAIEDYNKAISINPNYYEAYHKRGLAYAMKGEYAKAIEDYNRAIFINPNCAEVYIDRGVIYKDKGEYAKAIEDYNKAISINPNYTEAYNNRGNAYADKGEYARAIEDYNKAISINPNCAEAYNNRGGAYAIKGEYAKAIEDYNKAISINPNYTEAYNNRRIVYTAYLKKAIALEQVEKWKEALEVYRIVVRNCPSEYGDIIVFAVKKTQELSKKEGYK